MRRSNSGLTSPGERWASKANCRKGVSNPLILTVVFVTCFPHRRLARALKRERKKTAIAAQRDLEQLRLEYVAREQKFVMDGDRGELAKIKSELRALNESEMATGFGSSERDLSVQVDEHDEEDDNFTESFSTQGSKVYSPERYSPKRKGRGKQTPPEGKKNSPIKGLGAEVIEQEMARLEAERKELIATGIFDDEHPIIKEMDKRINLKLVELGQAN